MGRKVKLFTVIGLIFLFCGCRPTGPVTHTANFADLLIELRVSSDCVQPGERVKMLATVRNEGTTIHVTSLKEKPVLDIQVLFNAQNVWHAARWSDEQEINAGLTTLELDPGESKSIEYDWIADSRIYGTPATADAVFRYSEQFVDDPTLARVTVNVGSCPGLGP